MIYQLEHLEFLKKHSDLPRAELTERFNSTFKTTQKTKAICSVCKRYGYMTGRTGKFEKGSVPVNKGTKGLTQRNCTSFKKGHKPHNWKPVGSTRLSKDGYIEVKTREPNEWKLKHRVVWENANGPIPTGKILCFLDGNPQNVTLSNLKLISRRENALFNKRGFVKHPSELKSTLRNIIALEVKIAQKA